MSRKVAFERPLAALMFAEVVRHVSRKPGALATMPICARLINMQLQNTATLFTALALACALVLSGCGSHAVKKPPVAQKVTKKDDNQGRQKEQQRPLVAPPPAYGNKVVMR